MLAINPFNAPFFLLIEVNFTLPRSVTRKCYDGKVRLCNVLRKQRTFFKQSCPLVGGIVGPFSCRWLGTFLGMFLGRGDFQATLDPSLPPHILASLKSIGSEG